MTGGTPNHNLNQETDNHPLNPTTCSTLLKKSLKMAIHKVLQLLILEVLLNNEALALVCQNLDQEANHAKEIRKDQIA